MAKSSKTSGKTGTTKTYKRDTLKGRVVRRALTVPNCAEAVGPLEHGCEIYGLTCGDWSLVDLIEHCLNCTGPADVTLSTWTAGGADITFANALLRNGSIRSLRFIVDFSFPSRQPAYCAALREAFGDEAIRVTKNHAKFVLIRNAEWNLVLRTSMNLNENRRLENFEVSDDAGMAGWLQEVVDTLFAEQTAADAFGRKPSEHVTLFGNEWGHTGDKGEKLHFSDEPFGNDLRRAGLSYLKCE